MHTCYSPVRRSPPGEASFPRAAPRLACVKPAASVHPEPGSNSPLLFISFQNSFLLYFPAPNERDRGLSVSGPDGIYVSKSLLLSLSCGNLVIVLFPRPSQGPLQDPSGGLPSVGTRMQNYNIPEHLSIPRAIFVNFFRNYFLNSLYATIIQQC